jgi:RNA polymerase sigma factor (sigma-70 family)
MLNLRRFSQKVIEVLPTMETEPKVETTVTQWSVGELGAFFTDNRHFFLSHASRLMGNSTAAEELVQDALVRVLLAAPELPSKFHAITYFHRTLENLAKDIYRAEGRRPNLVAVDEVIAELDQSFIADSDHADVVQRADDLALVRDALSLLSPAERTALVMWEFDGRSTEEIARTIGVKEKSVRHTISRARASLRRILEERIVDETRGLTALDLMSSTFRRASVQVKKSSRVALSLLLILGFFLGLNTLTVTNVGVPLLNPSEDRQSNPALPLERESKVDRSIKPESNEVLKKKVSEPEVSVRSASPVFAGLDQDGVPQAFSVADETGLMGELFRGPTESVRTETGWMITNVVSNRSAGPNVLLDQTVITDAFGTSYLANVSIGMNGVWTPLETTLFSVDSERLASGGYLITARMMVKGTLDPIIQMPTGVSGTDLDRAPSQITVKLLLDPSKTEILAQAVLISGSSQSDGA